MRKREWNRWKSALQRGEECHLFKEHSLIKRHSSHWYKDLNHEKAILYEIITVKVLEEWESQMSCSYQFFAEMHYFGCKISTVENGNNLRRLYMFLIILHFILLQIYTKSQNINEFINFISEFGYQKFLSLCLFFLKSGIAILISLEYMMQN